MKRRKKPVPGMTILTTPAAPKRDEQAMDNVTHSLLGLAAAEGAWRLSRRRADSEAPPHSVFRGALWLASFLASNFPDSDVFFYGLIPGRLGPLLQHRGYTHTFVGAIPGAILVLLMVAGWLRLRRVSPKLARKQWPWISGVAVFGVFLHLFADSWNVYGTHLFWPASKRWFYGDFFFIAEPWVWMTFIPALFHASHGRELAGKAGRAFLLLLFAAALFAIWGLGLVPPLVATCLTLYGTGLMAWFIRKRARRESGAPILAAFALLALILAAFFCASRVTRSAVARNAGAFPKSRLHDVILSPLPANPLCWMVILVQTEADHPGETSYVLRKGLYSAAPAFLPSERCALPRALGGLARTTPLAPDRRVFWQAEFRAPLSELKRLWREDCRVGAFLRFARAPFWQPYGEGVLLLGDLRFDHGREPGFSNVLVEGSPVRCPPNVPGWREPRADLLNGED